MNKLIYDYNKVKTQAQDFHDAVDENGQVDAERIKDYLAERYSEEITEWLDELDWEQIESEILDDDREAYEDYHERREEAMKLQGWK